MNKRALPQGPQQKVERPNTELKVLLSEHLDVLQSHCNQFDLGKKYFAAEIALNLRVLLLNNPKNENRSLLHQLDQESLAFVDTAKTMSGGDPRILTAPVAGLASQTIIPRDGQLFADWEPNLEALNKSPHSTMFDSWWEAPVLYTDAGDVFSRRRIIRQMANQDRGGHVAPGIEKAYFELTRNANYPYETQITQGDAITNSNEPVSPERIMPVSKSGAGMRLIRALVRQVAHETIMTLLPDKTSYLASIPKPNLGISPSIFIQYMLR